MGKVLLLITLSRYWLNAARCHAGYPKNIPGVMSGVFIVLKKSLCAGYEK